MKTVTCNKCGWVHMQVSRSFAEDEVKTFNEYFNKLTKEKQDDYYGGKPAALEFYERCKGICGGSYKNFRDSVDGDCPNGCTINPIVDRNE